MFPTLADILYGRRLWLRMLVGLGAVGLIVGGWLCYSLIHSLIKPIPGAGDEVLFEVMPGNSFSRVANSLHDAGYISSPLAFKLLGRWRGVSNAIHSGEYSLPAGLSATALLDKMVAGENVQYRITLVEGWTFRQALLALWRAEKLSTTLSDANPEAIANAMGVARDKPEGLLFPDTYFYTKGTTDIELLRRANVRLQQVLENAWQTRLGALPYGTPYDALIMASIIEKESAVSSERGHIAGVFVRRLEQGMRLQSDPTVIYGLGDGFDGDLRRSDLQQTQNLYNTYRHNGLPPTPIALAGRESIAASLHPLPSDYLYFVSRGDGSHQFSSTLEQHNAAVQQFQRSQESR